jgi:hypothetical protein
LRVHLQSGLASVVQLCECNMSLLQLMANVTTTRKLVHTIVIASLQHP